MFKCQGQRVLTPWQILKNSLTPPSISKDCSRGVMVHLDQCIKWISTSSNYIRTLSLPPARKKVYQSSNQWLLRHSKPCWMQEEENRNRRIKNISGPISIKAFTQPDKASTCYRKVMACSNNEGGEEAWLHSGRCQHQCIVRAFLGGVYSVGWPFFIRANCESNGKWYKDLPLLCIRGSAWQ